MNKEIDVDNIKSLEDTFKKLGGDKATIGLSLISKAYFICKTLNNLKDIIEQDGEVEHFEQGKQNFFREHPALKSYNTTLGNYQKLMKQIYDILPTQTSGPDPLEEFNKR